MLGTVAGLSRDAPDRHCQCQTTRAVLQKSEMGAIDACVHDMPPSSELVRMPVASMRRRSGRSLGSPRRVPGNHPHVSRTRVGYARCVEPMLGHDTPYAPPPFADRQVPSEHGMHLRIRGDPGEP